MCVCLNSQEGQNSPEAMPGHRAGFYLEREQGLLTVGTLTSEGLTSCVRSYSQQEAEQGSRLWGLWWAEGSQPQLEKTQAVGSSSPHGHADKGNWIESPKIPCWAPKTQDVGSVPFHPGASLSLPRDAQPRFHSAPKEPAKAQIRQASNEMGTPCPAPPGR